ncbi:hypothetical protein [Bacillus andreraoultii]|uniref:hypothetical protein n=1 Tax=Bacillus andreraoultii TaxID=1499685 RepID=UPI00053A8AE0|nr:hypothetical protein [Bacillus andreraoultii]
MNNNIIMPGLEDVKILKVEQMDDRLALFVRIGLTSHEDKKTSIITWLEELIQEYLDKSSKALDNYAG